MENFHFLNGLPREVRLGRGGAFTSFSGLTTLNKPIGTTYKKHIITFLSPNELIRVGVRT